MIHQNVENSMIVNSLSLGCRQNTEPGTAVPAGRVFSIAGNIVTAKRLVFSPDKVGIQVFLMCCFFVFFFAVFFQLFQIFPCFILFFIKKQTLSAFGLELFHHHDVHLFGIIFRVLPFCAFFK